jgi:hypothetical protein
LAESPFDFGTPAQHDSLRPEEVLILSLGSKAMIMLFWYFSPYDFSPLLFYYTQFSGLRKYKLISNKKSKLYLCYSPKSYQITPYAV